jgi:hypothetical protein
MRVARLGGIVRKGKAKVYRIVVRSELSGRYAEAFDDMRLETEDGLTILAGGVKDQPHLYGILQRLNGLGLELLSVQSLSNSAIRVK